MEYKAIVLAAGSGSRMKAGKNKMLLDLGGKPLFIHALETFEQDPWCTEIMVVTKKEEQEIITPLIASHRINKVAAVIAGGRERQDSVRAGLNAISGVEGIVMIHDGARPFVSEELLHKLAGAAACHASAIPAVPVKDTIKKVSNGVIEETVDRSSLWAAQTPQAFRLPLIRKLHASFKDSGALVTDDASLAEQAGLEVKIIEGDDRNLKVTTPVDLLIAKNMIEMDEGRE